MYSCTSPVPSLQIPCGQPTQSPSSPKSWEESLDELSRGLQMICGSPVDLSPGSSSGYLGLTSPQLSPPTLSLKPTLSHIPEDHENFQPHTIPSGHVVNRASFGRSHSSGQQMDKTRPLMVRHEESQEKLQEKLAKICKRKSAPSAIPPDLSPRSAMLLRRESLKHGFRIRTDLSDYEVEDIVISVEGDRQLNVYAKQASNRDQALVFEMELPECTRTERLMCTVTSSKTLYIRERSSEAVTSCFVGIKSHYLPIMMEDENSSSVKCILHVPDEFAFEDLCVKTHDDSLVVSGHKHFRHINQLLTNSPEVCPCLQGLAKNNKPANRSSPERLPPSFRMVFSLPEGVDSRSVAASMSYQNQLIITASLGQSSRRYTC